MLTIVFLIPPTHTTVCCRRNVKPFSGDDSGATPPATASPTEISPSSADKHHFSFPRTTSNDHRPPPLTMICLHAFVEVEKDYLYPPSPARASPSVPTAKCVSEWVWGAEDEKGLFEVDAGKKKGGTRCLDRDTACDASKMLFLDKDDPASSTFDSVCRYVKQKDRFCATLPSYSSTSSSLMLVLFILLCFCYDFVIVVLVVVVAVVVVAASPTILPCTSTIFCGC